MEKPHAKVRELLRHSNVNLTLNRYSHIMNPMKPSLLSRLKKPNLARRIWKKFLKIFFIQPWVILISRNTSYKRPRWKDFKTIMPPYNCDWADPFLWKQDGHFYIFIEEKFFSAKHAHISCLTLDESLNVVSNQIVLQRPYHLSYPFIFSYDEQIYMMPETVGNCAIELYRCTGFPNQWEFFKTLIPDTPAVDATLLEKDGKWWLFANIRDEGGSTWNSLHLFSADNPLSDTWTPHPGNPIVKDVNTARPAGKIISTNGNIIRPSQDCSARYGYATNFMNIQVLSETDFAEIRENRFKPPFLSKIQAVHTWNQLDNLTVVDAIWLRRKKL